MRRHIYFCIIPLLVAAGTGLTLAGNPTAEGKSTATAPQIATGASPSNAIPLGQFRGLRAGKLWQASKPLAEKELEALARHLTKNDLAEGELAEVIVARWAEVNPEAVRIFLASAPLTETQFHTEGVVYPMSARLITLLNFVAGLKDPARVAAIVEKMKIEWQRRAAAAGLLNSIRPEDGAPWLDWAMANYLEPEAAVLIRRMAAREPAKMLARLDAKTSEAFMEGILAGAIRADPVTAFRSEFIGHRSTWWNFCLWGECCFLEPLEAARTLKAIYGGKDGRPWPTGDEKIGWGGELDKHFEWSAWEEPKLLKEFATILPDRWLDRCLAHSAMLMAHLDANESERLIKGIKDPALAADAIDAIMEQRKEAGEEVWALLVDPAITMAKDWWELLKSQAESDLPAVRKFVDSLPPGVARREASLQLALYVTDGADAFELLTRDGVSPNGDGAAMQFHFRTSGFLSRIPGANETPETCLAKIFAPGAPALPEVMLGYLLNWTAQMSPDAYLKEYETRKHPPAMAGYLGRAFAGSTRSMEEMKALAETVPQEHQTNCRSELVEVVRKTNLIAAGQLFKEMLQTATLGSHQMEAQALELSEQFATDQSFQAAADWAQALPKSMAPLAFSAAIAKGAERDAKAAAAYLKKCEHGATKDAGIRALCRAIWKDDPAGAWNLAMSASQPDRFLLRSLHILWKARDSAAADAAFSQAGNLLK